MSLNPSYSRWYKQMAWGYVEAFSDQTIGLIMRFYGQIKIILLLSLSIPRFTVRTLPLVMQNQPES